MTSFQVFLDANALIYSLDETSDQYDDVVALVQQLLKEGAIFCTSHHVIEEVLHIARKISGTSAADVIKEVDKLPGLVLIEPDASLDFAKRYAILSDKFSMGVNDALLLQLMLDAEIKQLLSYDKQFVNRAINLGIKQVT